MIIPGSIFKSYINRTTFLFVIFLLMFQNTVLAETNTLSFDLLKQRLVKEGFNPDTIDKIYNHRNVFFEIDGISRYFRYSESKLDYDQFLSPMSITKAEKYMKEFNKELDQTETAFGVDKEIITAILLVETQLGSYLGNKSIINTLSTLAALSDEDFRQIFWEKMPSTGKYEKQEYEKKAREKAKWALKELKAFLSYCEKEGFDPTETKGSFAGALGIAQFMPSNILKLAVDGNNDGRIDLFNHADAIMSIANYLKYHKWHKGMDHENAYRVLLSYNYSKPYAETLLKIAERLKK